MKLEKELIEVAVGAIKVVQATPQSLHCAHPAVRLLLGLMHYVYEAPQALAAALHLLPAIHSQPQATS